MVQQKRSRRLNPVDQAISSSANVPAPSTTRIAIAGTTDRGVAAVGDVLQRIGLVRQAADDKIELDSARITLMADTEETISSLAASEQSPTAFEEQATKGLNKIFKKAAKSVGGRNRDSLGVVIQSAQAAAEKSIRSIKTSKTLDIAKAQRQVIGKNIMSRAAVNISTTPNDGQAEDIALKETAGFLTSQFDAGLISADAMTAELAKTTKDLTLLRVDSLMTQGKSKEALEVLAKSDIDPNDKITIRFQVGNRINKIDTANNKKLKAENELLESQYDELAIAGELPEQSDTGLSLETLRTSTLSPKAKRRIATRNQAIVDKGGIGDELGMNELLVSINDGISDDPIINNDFINKQQESHRFNTEQELKLRNAIKTRLTSPIANRRRTDIDKQYGVAPLTGGSLLEKEARDQYFDTRSFYEAFLRQGLSPDESFANAIAEVGPPPDQSVVDESTIADTQKRMNDFSALKEQERKAGIRKSVDQKATDKFTMEFLARELERNKKILARKRRLKELVSPK